jgi:hypothetical protein
VNGTAGRSRLKAILCALALAAALTGISAGPVAAQETVEARLERLQNEVTELRRALAERETSGEAELRRQIALLTRQIEAMELGETVVQPDTSVFGFAPAASKVYRVRQGVSIGGYGEVLYENFAETRENGTDSGERDQFDALRAILYVGYKFNDRLLFNSELEWEHGSTGAGGEASIEFAYLDYMLSPSFGLRGGLLLAPMGLTNEMHEPPTFVGTTRPMVEQAIIPTTWRANGFGLFGEAGDLSYRAYALTSLDAMRGFSAKGLRGGRQKGAKELAEDFSLIGRVDYTGLTGLMIGGSAMIGGTTHGEELAGEPVDGTTTIVETHAHYEGHGFRLRGLYAVATVDDVAELNALRGFTGAQSIGERLTGGYAQAGYDVLRFADVEHQLIPYVRFEALNTQARVPAGFSADPATERTAWLLGAMWKPIPQVALKADYQIHGNEAVTGIDQLNVNLSYLF